MILFSINITLGSSLKSDSKPTFQYKENETGFVRWKVKLYELDGFLVWKGKLDYQHKYFEKSHAYLKLYSSSIA